MQLDAFAAKQFDGSQANRVRASRRSGREHPMLPIVGRRRSQQIGPPQFLPGGAIKLPNDKEVRKALDIRKPRLKLGQYFEHAVGVVSNAKTFGNLARDLVRTTHKSNRLRGKHTRRCLHFPYPHTSANTRHWSPSGMVSRVLEEGAVGRERDLLNLVETKPAAQACCQFGAVEGGYVPCGGTVKGTGNGRGPATAPSLLL